MTTPTPNQNMREVIYGEKSTNPPPIVSASVAQGQLGIVIDTLRKCRDNIAAVVGINHPAAEAAQESLERAIIAKARLDLVKTRLPTVRG